MEEKSKLWDPDYSQKLYTLTINVYKNCINTTVTLAAGKPMPSYHEILGAIESIKGGMMVNQSQRNKEAYEQFVKGSENKTEKPEDGKTKV